MFCSLSRAYLRSTKNVFWWPSPTVTSIFYLAGISRILLVAIILKLPYFSVWENERRLIKITQWGQHWSNYFLATFKCFVGLNWLCPEALGAVF